MHLDMYMYMYTCIFMYIHRLIKNFGKSGPTFAILNSYTRHTMMMQCIHTYISVKDFHIKC